MVLGPDHFRAALKGWKPSSLQALYLMPGLFRRLLRRVKGGKTKAAAAELCIGLAVIRACRWLSMLKRSQLISKEWFTEMQTCVTQTSLVWDCANPTPLPFCAPASPLKVGQNDGSSQCPGKCLNASRE